MTNNWPATMMNTERSLTMGPSSILAALDRSLSIMELATDGTIITANRNFCGIFGYTPAEIIGRHHSIFVEERVARSRSYREFWDRLGRGDFEAQEYKRIDKNGKDIWLQASYTPVKDVQGVVTHIIKVATDITKEKLRNAEFESMVNAISRVQGIIEFTTSGEIITANDIFLKAIGYNIDEIVDKHHRVFVEPDYAFSPEYQQFWKNLERGEYISAEFKRIGKGGRHVWLHASYNPIFDLNKNVIKVVKFTTDITERVHAIRDINARLPPHIYQGHSSKIEGASKADDILARSRLETQVTFLAYHDSLTGLPNRVAFYEALEKQLGVAAINDLKVAVVAIDLDRFKEVNDRHGHAAGDRVLKALADRLRAEHDQSETFARFGGDGVAAFVTYDDDDDLKTYLTRLKTSLTQVLMLDGFEINVGASIGVARFPLDDRDTERLLNKADLSMYRSKAGNSRTICFYTKEIDATDRYQRTIVNDIWLALKRRQFTVNYQVQKSISTGRILGYEALLRWTHPELGSVPPSDFIPLAEKCGAIIEIGRWVLETACAQAVGWKEPLKIAVNLSAAQFSDPELVDVIRQTLNSTGLLPKRLELEVTETAIIGDAAAALNILQQIKALGVQIAMDDFGTGYSSLSTLSAFPFDKIKIDRSFLKDAESRPQAKAIIRTILALGRTMNLPVLAEGVETGEQLAMLRLEGCNEAQGYFLGYPQSVEQLRLAGPATATTVDYPEVVSYPAVAM